MPLVKRERRLLDAQRGPVRSEPPGRVPALLAVGALRGGGLAGLGWKAPELRAARVALGALVAFSGFVLGLLGLIFVMFWTYTDHEVAHRNENLLQCVPWAVALAWWGVGVARGKAEATRKAALAATAAAAASALGLVCKVLPWFDQRNAEIIALLLPLWAGMALGLRRLAGAAGPAAPAPTTAPRAEGTEAAG